MYSGDNYDHFGWAVFMAGGSMAVLPELQKEFLCDASSMKPAESKTKDQWVLSNGKEWIVYSNTNTPIQLNVASGSYKVDWIDAGSGKNISTTKEFSGGNFSESSSSLPAVLWIHSK